MARPKGYTFQPREGINKINTVITDKTTNSVVKITKQAQQALKRKRGSSRRRYKHSADGFRDILIEILNANDNTIDWLDRFRDFDFDHGDFNHLKRRYHRLAATTGYRQLKWSCSLISEIYEKQIASKIGDLIKDDNEVKKIRSLFATLKGQDERLIAFVKKEFFAQFEDFVKKVEPQVDKGNMNVAKNFQSEFKNKTQDLYQRLTKKTDELSELIDKFNRLYGDSNT